MNKDNKQKKIALLGLGLDNLSLLNLLLKQNLDYSITICDKRKKSMLPKFKDSEQIKYQLGSTFNKNLDQFDIMFRSPGWPILCPGIQSALKKGTKLSSALEVFFNTSPSKNIIGITGTKGKGTTSTLIYKILSSHFKKSNTKVWLGGNIGISPLSFLSKVKKDDYVVLELSSFQLEDLKISPKISVLTNLFKEHLAPADPNNPNYHKTLGKYFDAKLNIARHKENKYLICNQALKSKIKDKNISGKVIYFSNSDLPTKLKGDYNNENIAAAIEVAKLLKIKPEVYKQVIKNFGNLENRLEEVANIKGVSYLNNSFSTTPESTKLDLLSFENDIILLAGGADKGANFNDLAKTIKERVKLLILFPGKGSDEIEKSLNKINFDKKKLIKVDSMKEAVRIAHKSSEGNDIILLSTACASFGLFKNYKERGKLFKQEVDKLNKNV